VQGKDFLLKREIPFFEKSKHFWQVATTKILSSIFVLARSQEQDRMELKGMSQYDLIEEQGEEGNPFANQGNESI
jgi:hypothetical protein